MASTVGWVLAPAHDAGVDGSAHPALAAALREGGCDDVLVVSDLSAALDGPRDADAAVLAPVGLRGLPASVVERVLSAAPDRADLARAAYGGVPGAPIALGRDHWDAFHDALPADGGNAYLEEHDAIRVECGDLFSGVVREP